MKGFIPIDIPTKSYIKAYIHHKLGEKPVMRTDHFIGNKLYDLLTHPTNPDKNDFCNKRYNATIRVYVAIRVFRMRGCNLNETNIKNFNQFLESIIKERFYELMDHYIDILPSFEANLPEVRRLLGIDIDAWSDDSMKKDYYRHRKYSAKPLLYKKNNYGLVPCGNFPNAPF